jgi:uncharacterized DUF497 family protein
VAYEWDPKKAASNLRKHKVDFADAVAVFEDDFAVTIDDDESKEKRFVTDRNGRTSEGCGGCLHVAGKQDPPDFCTQGRP